MAEPFENAPNMGQQFQQSQQREEPQELNFDPPEKVWDHNRVMQPTPMGTIDVQVTRELDPAAQQAIVQSQQQEPTLEKQFQEQAAERQQRDEFQQRMIERFNHAREQNRGPQR